MPMISVTLAGRRTTSGACIRQTLYPRNRRRSTALTCQLRFSFAARRASWTFGMRLMKRPFKERQLEGMQRPRLLASTRAAPGID